jgi:hypothetical protein
VDLNFIIKQYSSVLDKPRWPDYRQTKDRIRQPKGKS